MNNRSIPYKALCTEYYDLDKPSAPQDALHCYLQYAQEAKGAILEPMCGSGSFLIPLLERGYAVMGFDYSPHMLEVCRSKCKALNITCNVMEATFETFPLSDLYDLIIIPSGSFCLLTTFEEIQFALTFIYDRLKKGGKFVFDVETLKAVGDSQGVWKGNWVSRADGAKIVISSISRFNPLLKIETVMCRYELWEENAIVQTEVEDFRLRLYEPAELEQLLKQHGLTVIGKWQAEPYVRKNAHDTDAVITYECMKE